MLATQTLEAIGVLDWTPSGPPKTTEMQLPGAHICFDMAEVKQTARSRGLTINLSVGSLYFSTS